MRLPEACRVDKVKSVKFDNMVWKQSPAIRIGLMGDTIKYDYQLVGSSVSK